MLCDIVTWSVSREILSLFLAYMRLIRCWEIVSSLRVRWFHKYVSAKRRSFQTAFQWMMSFYRAGVHLPITQWVLHLPVTQWVLHLPITQWVLHLLQDVPRRLLFLYCYQVIWYQMIEWLACC